MKQLLVKLDIMKIHLYNHVYLNQMASVDHVRLSAIKS